jgi:hypothetical protein
MQQMRHKDNIGSSFEVMHDITQEEVPMSCRKCFQHVGIVSMLLFVGVLGGLMVPLSSEAKTLSIQVDNGNPVDISLANAACPSGFTDCSSINGQPIATGSGGKAFQVQPAPGTAATAAKLLIADFTASDAFKFTGIKIAPTSFWSATESHTVKIVATHTLNANPNGAGNYVWALRSGGYLLGGGSPLTTQYDWLRFEGTGIFNPDSNNGNPVELLNVAPQTTNLDPLTLQIANFASATFFTLSQVVTYPTFNCDNNGAASGGACTPILTLTMTVTLFGPDSLVLTDSNDGQGGGPCNLDNAKGGKGGPPGGNPAIPCHSNTKKTSEDDNITDSFTNQDSTDVSTAMNNEPGIVRAVQCQEEDNCPCANPLDPKCAANVIHVLMVTPGLIQTFPFTATGSGISPDFDNYTIKTDANGDGSTTIGPLPAVGGGPWTFTKGVFPSPPEVDKIYDIDSIACVSTLEPTDPLNPLTKVGEKLDGFTTWTADGGSLKLKVIVHTLKGGDTLTCGWHVHRQSINQQH